MKQETLATCPSSGEKITFENGKIVVPDNPIIPFIIGDGIGADVTPAMQKVVDAAVDRSYGGKRSIVWMEVYAGEKAHSLCGEHLPQETVDFIEEYRVAIKGPLATPVGGGMRSLNVLIRQTLDLFVCQRPVRYFEGTSSPVVQPELVDMVIFRENSEDIYAGIEFQAGSEAVARLIRFLQEELSVDTIRFPQSSSIGIKPVSREGSERLIRAAFQYAIDNNRDSVTLVHKGNIMKYTEGGFRNWGYELATREFGAEELGGDWKQFKNPKTGQMIVVKDVIADAFLQQIILRPQEYSVIATMNLNGDYLSDALAAQVGGIGISPGANLSDEVAVFEATHGTAPKYVGLDKVNPSSCILSGEMMLRYMQMYEAADLVMQAMEDTIRAKHVTYDLARGVEDATKLSCSAFTNAVINRM